ncbi:MAG TPA: multiheme c-type cytochrome [Tepidisphaeraceae bacterium]|nr:multiheme c-type cytochrome [Tepidisphaeraceae bacterium]
MLAIALVCAGAWLSGCGQAPAGTEPQPQLAASNSSQGTTATVSTAVGPSQDAYEAHADLFKQNRFPSAAKCGQCHPTQFRQWSVSQHSYAQLSPIFNAMQGKTNRGNNGTQGDFCIRCHTQPGMIEGESEFMSNIDRSPIAREGVTCVVCHRISEPMGKVSGRLPLDEGEVTQPVYGPTGRNTELQKAIAAEDLITNPHEQGKKVHGELKKFFRITTSNFCGSCHDVTLFNGFRLEEAFSEYKHSPAAANGVLCQDCHMGKEPGRILAPKTDPNFIRINYAFGPAAKVGDFLTAPRKLTNHMFVGPDYSVVPPWLFPHHRGAIRDERDKSVTGGLATIREWETFDWKAGWGTDEFESHVPAGTMFPQRWVSADDRRAARQIIDENQALLAEMSQNRLILQRNGYKLGDIVVRRCNADGIEFAVQVRNGTDGHGVPTGFDVERPVWVHVTVKDSTGKIVKESGDLDPNGDVRDLQSQYVHNAQLPLDTELLSLQGHFVVHMQHGSEREQVLATNFSPSPLPFLRPERMSSILQGRPQGARKQKNNIEPLGERWATYHVDKAHLTGHGPYTATVQLKTAMVPVNLVNEVQVVGFDYSMTTKTIVQNLVAGHRVVWERSVVLGDGN